MPLTFYKPEEINISFEEWRRRKQEEQEEYLKGAEKVDLENVLYDIFFSVDLICFDRMFQFMPFYWIPEALKDDPETIALFGHNTIMIDKGYFDAQGLSEDMINTVFHELCHAYNDWKNIPDTDHGVHLRSFADTCESHGGTASYQEELGWTIARLKPDIMDKVMTRIKRKTGR